MKTLGLTCAALLLAAPEWSSDCPDSSSWGEHLALELVLVTVDGEPLKDLAAYSGYTVSVTNFLDDETSETEYLEFWANRYAKSGAREQDDTVLEYYAVESVEPAD